MAISDDFLEDSRDHTIATLTERIASIDKMFDDATGWGSWMVECANEREAAVNKLARLGVKVEHKNLARTSGGSRVD